ncbi:MAG: RES domain-containing protein [Actinomycetes bacterium]
MLLFRHGDPRYPFAWESAGQPPGRWNDEGTGPALYLADTPDGAWAEFLRHEGIVEADDLAHIERRVWTIDVPDSILARAQVPLLARGMMTGGFGTWAACQAEARRLRKLGHDILQVPSAALLDGAAGGQVTSGGLVEAPARGGLNYVLYGHVASLVGWACVDVGRPTARQLSHVRQLAP